MLSGTGTPWAVTVNGGALSAGVAGFRALHTGNLVETARFGYTVTMTYSGLTSVSVTGTVGFANAVLHVAGSREYHARDVLVTSHAGSHCPKTTKPNDHENTAKRTHRTGHSLASDETIASMRFNDFWASSTNSFFDSAWTAAMSRSIPTTGFAFSFSEYLILP
jgi:hypothetical protein